MQQRHRSMGRSGWGMLEVVEETGRIHLPGLNVERQKKRNVLINSSSIIVYLTQQTEKGFNYQHLVINPANPVSVAGVIPNSYMQKCLWCCL